MSGLQRRQDREPDRPRSDHENRFASTQACFVHRVEPYGHRFRQCGGGDRGAIRNWKHHALREHHVLGEAAGNLFVVPDRERLRTKQHGYRTNELAGIELTLGVGTVVDHLCTKFVTQHDRIESRELEGTTGFAARRDEIVGMKCSMQIGAADTAGARFDEHLAGPGCRIVDRLDPEPAPLHQYGLHDGSPVRSEAATEGAMRIRRG